MFIFCHFYLEVLFFLLSLICPVWEYWVCVLLFSCVCVVWYSNVSFNLVSFIWSRWFSPHKSSRLASLFWSGAFTFLLRYLNEITFNRFLKIKLRFFRIQTNHTSQLIDVDSNIIIDVNHVLTDSIFIV